MLLTESLRYHQRVHPRSAAVITDSESVDFATLHDLVSRAAGLIRSTVQPGGHMGVSLGTTLDHVVVLYAAAAAGVTLVELDPKWGKQEIKQALSSFDLQLVIVDAIGVLEVFRELLGGSVPTLDACPPGGLDVHTAGIGSLQQWFPLVGSEEHVISPAGGTSGRMKGICIDHAATAARFHSQMVEFGIPEGGSYLAGTPLFHGGARSLGLGYLYFGRSMRLVEKLDVERLPELSRVTTASFVVPTLLGRIASYDARLDPGFRVICGGSILDPATVDDVLSRITENVYDYYASVDTGPISVLKPSDIVSRRSSVGRPAFGITVDIESPGPDGFGDVLIRGRTLSSRYVGDVDSEIGQMLEDSRIAKLGDVGRIDGEGYLSLRGRSDDVIITGGVNVSVIEVESSIARLPEVAEVVVVGAPSAEWGQAVAAGVVWSGSPLSRDELAARLDGAISRVKIPKIVVDLDALPLTSIGKVNRRQALEMILKQGVT